MDAIEFNEVNLRIGENQPEYITLPVMADFEDTSKPVTMCFQLTADEIAQVHSTGRIWLTLLTFGAGFPPIATSCLKPENVTEPEPEKQDCNMLKAEIIVYLPDGCSAEKEQAHLKNSLESNFAEVTNYNVFTVNVEAINVDSEGISDVEFEDNTDVEFEECHICGNTEYELFECQRCHELFCSDCKAVYNQFTMIDYDCCKACGERSIEDE